GVAAWRDGAPHPAALVLTWPAVEGVEGAVRLRDRATGTEVDLRTERSYRFTLAPGDTAPLDGLALERRPELLRGGAPRFVLVVGGVTTDEQPPGAAPVQTALFAPAPNPLTSGAEVRYALA